MGTRYYKFFAIMRMAMMNQQLEFSAPGNLIVYKVLTLLREKGLISGFSLDFERKNEKQGYWDGYPKYKVYLKYSYLGYPVIKKLDCYKMTKTNFTTVTREKKTNKNEYCIISSNRGITMINSSENRNSASMLAKIKV